MPESFIENVRQSLVELGVRKGDRCLVALSGGGDSTALLLAMERIVGADNLVAAHLDHNVRAGSGKDREKVEYLCWSLGVTCKTGVLDTEEVADRQRRSGSLEGALRQLRYSFLENEASEAGCQWILTGHTWDDQAETVLFRSLRNMNWRALCGIPGKRDKIVRPMLGITGKQAREYCRSRGVMFLEDPTNRENSFARNRLRNLTLPTLGRTFHPDVASLLVRLSRLSDSLVNFERGILNRSPKAPDQSIEFLDLVNWRRFPEILKESVLIAFLENGMKSYPSASLLEDINDFLLGKATGTMDLPGGLQLDVAHEKAVIRPTFHKERNALPSRPVKIVVPGRTELAVSGLAIETELRPFSGDLDLSDPDLAFLSLEKAGSSLYARRRQQGDRITPLGMGKVKKLKELLINRKIPKKTRDSIPIVVDASGDIVWVGGVEISEKAALDRYDGEMMIILRLERSGSA